VSPDKLFAQFPWLKEAVERSSVLDATKLSTFSGVSGELQFKYFDQPAFLQVLHSRIAAADRPIYIVVDSIEALKASVGAGSSLESSLINMACEAGAHMVLVSESVGESPLDYMVDGIIVLLKRRVGSQVVRELVIEKLRGVDVRSYVKPFTLDGGRFNLVTYDDVCRKVAAAAGGGGEGRYLKLSARYPPEAVRVISEADSSMEAAKLSELSLKTSRKLASLSKWLAIAVVLSAASIVLSCISLLLSP